MVRASHERKHVVSPDAVLSAVTGTGVSQLSKMLRPGGCPDVRALHWPSPEEDISRPSTPDCRRGIVGLGRVELLHRIRLLQHFSVAVYRRDVYVGLPGRLIAAGKIELPEQIHGSMSFSVVFTLSPTSPTFSGASNRCRRAGSSGSTSRCRCSFCRGC